MSKYRTRFFLKISLERISTEVVEVRSCRKLFSSQNLHIPWNEGASI